MIARQNNRYLGICTLAMGILIGYLIASAKPSTPVGASESPPNQSSGPSTLVALTQDTDDDTHAISPTKATANRDTYYPGTEDLKPDEMRVTALGTGMPSARPKQAAACFLVENQGFAPLEALTVGTQGHTLPEQFGKVMALVKPRIAVGYHFYKTSILNPTLEDA